MKNIFSSITLYHLVFGKKGQNMWRINTKQRRHRHALCTLSARVIFAIFVKSRFGSDIDLIVNSKTYLVLFERHCDFWWCLEAILIKLLAKFIAFKIFKNVGWHMECETYVSAASSRPVRHIRKYSLSFFVCLANMFIEITNVLLNMLDNTDLTPN